MADPIRFKDVLGVVTSIKQFVFPDGQAAAAHVPHGTDGNPLFTGDKPGLTQERSAQGATPMTVGGAAVAAGRLLFVNCEAAGNVSVTFVDNSTLIVPVSPGPQFLPLAVTKINATGTTATATYANLS